MELNYIKCGDYYIPDIKLKNPNIRLGKWGRMRREYLRQARPILFSDMVLSETLYEHCAEVEATAKSRMELIVPQLILKIPTSSKSAPSSFTQKLSTIHSMTRSNGKPER